MEIERVQEMKGEMGRYGEKNQPQFMHLSLEQKKDVVGPV